MSWKVIAMKALEKKWQVPQLYFTRVFTPCWRKPFLKKIKFFINWLDHMKNESLLSASLHEATPIMVDIAVHLVPSWTELTLKTRMYDSIWPWHTWMHTDFYQHDMLMLMDMHPFTGNCLQSHSHYWSLSLNLTCLKVPKI